VLHEIGDMALLHEMEGHQVTYHLNGVTARR
jgi:hypothetical protein